jgi:hypothetical protein
MGLPDSIRAQAATLPYLDVVFVMMLTTSILGGVLTERFAPRMLERQKLKNMHLPNAEEGSL